MDPTKPAVVPTGALPIGGEVAARFDLASAGLAGHRQSVGRASATRSDRRRTDQGATIMSSENVQRCCCVWL